MIGTVLFIAIVVLLAVMLHKYGKSEQGSKVINKVEDEDDGA